MRTDMECPSRGRNAFTRAVLRVKSPGPISVLRATLPLVPAAGNRNAVGSNHCVTDPAIGLSDAPGFRFGRSGLSELPSFDRLVPSCTVKGNPEYAVRMPLASHPRPNHAAGPVSASPGRRTVALTASLWRMSNGERPQSACASLGSIEIAGVFCVSALPQAVADDSAFDSV